MYKIMNTVTADPRQRRYKALPNTEVLFSKRLYLCMPLTVMLYSSFIVGMRNSGGWNCQVELFSVLILGDVSVVRLTLCSEWNHQWDNRYRHLHQSPACLRTVLLQPCQLGLSMSLNTLTMVDNIVH